MRYLDFVLDLPPALRHPMEKFLRRSDAIEREELLSWNTSAETVEYALFYVEGDVERYREKIQGVSSVRDVSLTPIDDGSFYAYVCQETREEDEAWRRSFARRSLVVLPPLEYGDHGVRMTVVGESADLQALVEELPEAIDVTIEEVGDYDHRHATVVGGLTDRQREAVEVAVDLGYYAVPRGATLEAIADELGCAPSTASNHLQKAEARVMHRLVAGSTRTADQVASRREPDTTA